MALTQELEGLVHPGGPPVEAKLHIATGTVELGAQGLGDGAFVHGGRNDLSYSQSYPGLCQPTATRQ